MAISLFIAIFAATTAVSYVLSQQAMKKAKKAADDMAGVLVNKESNIEPIPVIYGERRVGGVRVFVSTKDVQGGDKNEYLYIALAMAEGEVESITDIYIDDVPITDSKYSGLYTINVHTGADDQAYDPLLSEANSGWTSDHKLSGVAYLAIRLKWDRDVFSGVPDITAIVQGRKVYDPRTTNTVYSNNPALCIRDYLTNNRYGKGVPSSAIDDTAFITAANDCDESVTFYPGGGSGKIFECNTVLQTDETLFSNIEKMLMGCRGFLPYNQGYYSLIIDKSRSSVFAFDKETIVGGISIKGETKENKFNRVLVKFANPVVDYQPDQAVWPEAGSTEESNFLAEDNGTLLVEELTLDTITNFYAARDLARVILKRSRNALRTSFKATSEALQLSVGDVVTVTHETPGWDAKPFQVEAILLNYDGTCDVSLLEYDSTIYTYDLSAEQKVYPDTNLPNPFEVSAPTGLTAVSTTVIADDGTLLPSLRLNWTRSEDSFVSQYEVQYQRGSAIIDLGSIAAEYTESENYGLITAAASVLLDYGSIDEPVETDEPDYNSTFVTTTQYVLQGITPSANYNIRIRAINDFGVKSNFISISGLAEGDVDAPSIPDSIAAVGSLREITISWTPPTDPDYSHVEIWENSVNNFATATKVAIAGGDYFSRTGLGYNVLKYYWLKSVDYSGNISDVSSVVSATTLFVDADSFSEEVNNLFSEAGAYGIEPVATLPATGDFDGQIKYDTTANKLYRWDATAAEWTDDIFSITTGSVDLASFAAGIEPIAIVSTLPNPVGYTGAQLVFLTTDYKIYRYTGTAFTAEIPAADIDGALALANFPSDLRPIEIVTSLPTTGNFQGRQVFLTTDNKTYRYTGTAFTAKIATVDLEGTVASLQIASDAVTNAKIAVDAIQGDVIAAGAITSAKILDGAINELKLANDAVTSAKLANEAVTSDIIAAGAITETKVSSNAITSAKIVAGSITTAKIAAGAVTADTIASNSISTAKLQAGSVTADTIASNSITSAKIAAGSITASDIAANTITAANIAAGAITASEIAADAVTASKIAANSVTAESIVSGSITTIKIAADAITANEIATGAITADAISAGSITTAAIAADAITANLIAANAITAESIAAGAITTTKLAADSVTAGAIQAGAVSTSELAANAITADKIQAGTITSDRIAVGTLQGDRIAANTITGGLIAASGIITSAAQINDAVIEAAKIANLAVTSAKIANLAVTTGKIANLSVDTLQIAGNAVTLPNSSYTATATNLSESNGEVTQQTVSYTSAGVSVNIFASIVFFGYDDDNTNEAVDVAFSIRRNGTLIGSATPIGVDNWQFGDAGNGRKVRKVYSVSLKDNPPAGSVTYILTAKLQDQNGSTITNNPTITLSNKSLVTLEVKK